MPKVETSALIKRGDNNRLAAPHEEKCVSKCFGSYGKFGYKSDNSRFGLEIHKKIQFRFKRNVDEANLDIKDSLPKRRVVKKLIRIQPIYNQTLELNNSSYEANYFYPNDNLRLTISHSDNSFPSSSEENYSASSVASRKHYRKRVVIKKRRKKRPTVFKKFSTTYRRRTVVVTKKRLLTKSSETTALWEYLTLQPVAVITPTSSKALNLPTLTTEASDLHNSSIPLPLILDTETTSKTNEDETSTPLRSEYQEVVEPSNTTVHKNLPDYEPYFPELSESLHNPALLLKTRVITSVEYETKTVTQSRLRTYTFVITRLSGDEQIVTSTVEVKPQTKTLTVTEPRTKFTTLTLLDLDATETLPFVPLTVDSSSPDTTPHHTDTQEYDHRIFEEARYNLATRVMSNGVEVIVAGDKSTLPGEPDVKRILPSSIYKPVTLKPSTLSDHMMMLLPQEASNVESLSSSLYPNQFVTKTCLTTFTYLTTFLENGSTTVSSHEQVVSNIATEERNSGKIIPTPSTGITLTQHPNLAVGTFLTTYTYLNTILDGEQPLVVTSKHTVTNTVTAPDDYLSLLQPPKKASAVKDTNTYYSTISLEKTLYEGSQSKIVSTDEVVTQVVITESVPPKATSVMTSYIALDFEENGHNSLNEYSTTDVVKTYYVTYTYFNTFLENENTVVRTNVSTSSDVVTEKLFLHPKRTHSNSVINTSPISKNKKKDKINVIAENLQIYATKTYVTTFTHFTTLLQENGNDAMSTIISSHTKEVENVLTVTVDPNLLNKQYLSSLKNELKDENSLVKVATLHNGQKLEITAIKAEKIEPTKVLPIEKTQMVETTINPTIIDSSNPSVVTGSTIIFFDDEDQVTKKPTPSLTSKPKITKTATKNGLGSLLSSEIVKKSQATTTHKQSSKSQTKRHTNKQTRVPIVSSKTAAKHSVRVTAVPLISIKNKTNIALADPPKKKTTTKIAKPAAEIPDLLGLGSINMNTLHALKPVINAMAGLIKTNLKGIRKNDTLTTTSTPNFDVTVPEKSKTTFNVPPTVDTQNRSPIYIPLGDQEDGLEIAESQNIASIHINEWEEDKPRPHKDQIVVGKPTHESPLLNGGIPISPGQVITANSDVIVGKPGRIGPRIPSIPLKNHQDEIPVDMKPPPAPYKTWPKRHNDKLNDHVPGASLRKEKPSLGGKGGDYFGPPPPPSLPKVPLRPPNFVRGEKHKVVDHKRIPLPRPNQEPNRIPVTFQNIELPQVQQVHQHPQVIFPHIEPVQIPLAAPTIVLTTPINDFNIQPSVLNEPIVLPEVIERSSGQPLLVNLQPSQVAFVNIPHNRTTALIYGGSTEPHRNGQYFDDPSPYPEPEFSGIEHFSNGVPQYASVYDDTQPPNQKQVGGVIKVGTEVINNNPPTLPSTIPSQIRPSRPVTRIPNKGFPPHAINVNVPPISFGMVHHGNDFNAHIINHGSIKFSPPPAPYDVVPNIDNQNLIQPGIVTQQQPNLIPIMQHSQNAHLDKDSNGINPNSPIHDRPLDQTEDLRPPTNEVVRPVPKPDVFESHLHFHPPNKHRLRPKPNVNNGVMEYLTPPHVNKFTHDRPEIPIKIEPAVHIDILPPPSPSHHHHHYTRPHIPISLGPEISVPIPPVQNRPQISISLEPEVSDVNFVTRPDFPVNKPVPIPLTPENYGNNLPVLVPPTKQQEAGGEIDNHKEDDMANEAGEVIQESNPRPLRPGQIPLEVLRANQSTTKKPSSFKHNNIRFPDIHNVNFGIQVAGHDNDIPAYRKPVIQEPRPFEIGPVVRPGNQQTNQINHQEQPFFVHAVNGQDGPFVRPENHFSNQVKLQDHHTNQNVYEYATASFTTKQPQYYLDGIDNVSVTFGQRIPNLSDSYYPTETTTENSLVNRNPSNASNVFYTTSKPPITRILNKEYSITTSTPHPNFYEKITLGSVEIVPVDTNIVQKRPHITSLPVNPTDTTRKPVTNIYEYAHNFGFQTEKPFDSSFAIQKTHAVNSNDTTFSFNNNDVISTQNVPAFAEKHTTEKHTTEAAVIGSKTPQNIAGPAFEPPTSLSANITSLESDMEIMRPPPPPEPATSMQPPRIEVHSPSGGIHRVPSLNIKRPIYDLESQASSPSPHVPRPMEDIVPPKSPLDEEVMGLSPPPPITTHRPILHFSPNISTHKPIFSLEIDPPRIADSRPIHPYTFETPATTVVTNKRRRPGTRRPYTRRTTTSTNVPVVTRRPTYNWQKPVTPIDVIIFSKNKTAENTLHKVSEMGLKETSVTSAPSTTTKNKQTMDIILGNPNVSVDVGLTTTSPKAATSDNSEEESSKVEVVGSEVSLATDSTPAVSTKVIKVVSVPTVKGTSTVISTKPIHAYATDVPTVNHNFTTGVHHAGNEVRVVDDLVNITVGSSAMSTTASPSIKPTSSTAVYKENKIIVPTRYITHTKTSTVTITKTTVVKTLGGPPITTTILVTKTEKSTKVDTVTEIHTLVKPTSIIETVTTTVNQIPTTLYPPDVPYGSTYSSYPPVLPTPTLEPSVITTSSTSTISTITEAEDDLEEFIIRDTDTPSEPKLNTSVHIPTDNDSIFVVMTDQKHGEVITIPKKDDHEVYETQSRDEVPTNNEVNHVLLGGILIASPPSLETPDLAIAGRQDKCSPECKASKNELCQKVEGIMRCICRPGFARMFPDRPCKPTYTYSIKLGLDRHGKEKLRFEESLVDTSSPEFNRLATVTHEALDRMIMQSDLRDIYHGVHVHSYAPVLNEEGIINNFYLQLSDNTDEQRLKEIIKKYLRNNNYSLGGTDLYASKGYLDNLAAEDFDECANTRFHDCSEYAHCFNLPGTYTCSCKEDFSDLSENSLYPGRICSAELIGCEKCHYHGTCYSRGDDQVICECFQWYAGQNCHINLKVLLIALVTLGTLLFALLLVCIILTCSRRKPHNAGLANGMSFMPQRLASHNGRRATIDRRAMIQDTSSEGSQSDTNTLPYVAKKPKKQPKGALKKTTPVNINVDVENGTNTFPDQKDRSLTVMIPRAKYHPAPPTSPHLNMETFDKRKPSATSSNEAKLLSYLDAGPSPCKVEPKQKYGNTSGDSFRREKSGPRKLSGGALVSAGFEVSATVGGIMGTMGTINTTCGTEADRSENATLIQKISADLLSSTGTRSQFTTFRKSLVDNDIDDPLSNWLDIPPKVTTTVSEARSYDETTIQAPTKTYRNGYDSKPSSQHQNDEANTMAERDVGSTFLLPHTHLYKPDRGSDISGFDSL